MFMTEVNLQHEQNRILHNAIRLFAQEQEVSMY